MFSPVNHQQTDRKPIKSKTGGTLRTAEGKTFPGSKENHLY